ncbi:MAG: type II toxin-antitoxin system VapC family toxin [Anaerolineae bacterium]|nr:type II toxin-antitoxin system VapC family toxin [Anaerolineae bacterium]
MIVADTNLLIYLYLPGPFQPLALEALAKDDEWIAPYLWRSEFRNVLASFIRREIITVSQAQVLMAEALTFMQEREYHPLHDEVLQLVADSCCSSYDCEFVSLAQEMDIPLVSMDKQILKEFPQFAVSLQIFVT